MWYLLAGFSVYWVVTFIRLRQRFDWISQVSKRIHAYNRGVILGSVGKAEPIDPYLLGYSILRPEHHNWKLDFQIWKWPVRKHLIQFEPMMEANEARIINAIPPDRFLH
jgi:hypothetical protein